VALASASAVPAQSYRPLVEVIEPEPELVSTGVHVSATAVIAVVEPVRPSLRKAPP
jgi:hypothetical protein